ncbi:hypothetical protein [Cytobacillus firmus]|uniref:hypothetical protein n=1 Tax=Cytobacillus firmus TaxID=1399 RepID=UPI001CFE291E|nr:hypothetical protein [Cytobacillus firmus]
MKEITKVRIKKINTIDSEILPITLLKSLELFWSLDRIIDDNVCFTSDTVDDYVTCKRRSEEIKKWICSVGERISTDYLCKGNGTYFSAQLKDYLGFDKDDEVAESIIDEYVMSEEQNKDINELKRELIEQAMILDALY